MQPFNYGQALNAAETIQGNRLSNLLTKQKLNPNSPINKLSRLQLEGQQLKNYLDYQKLMNPDSESYGKSVIWGLDANNKPVPLMPGDRGTLRRPENPEGITGFVDPVKYINLGDVQYGYGSRSGKPVGSKPINLNPSQTPEHLRGVEEIKTEGARNRAAAEFDIKTANEAFAKAYSVRQNVGNLQKVIEAVKDGANTGPLVSRLPSFKEASVRLDNLRSQLGLDVVGAVTFGALSEGELNLALNTALPTNLKGPELVKWARDKAVAQTKLADYLVSQATFLRRGGTLEDWYQQRSQPKSKGNETLDELLNMY